MEEAVSHMTGRSAARLSLKDRGLLKAGFKADLVLFDAASVLDLSTYESPRTAARGFESVWIDGVKTLSNGERTSRLPGKAIRSNTKAK
jgi:N-acyl-D-amino-acid deacylase